ncbi:MAG: hypothetical protein ACTSWW_03885 [Promethearchaeota archaeon]
MSTMWVCYSSRSTRRFVKYFLSVRALSVRNAWKIQSSWMTLSILHLWLESMTCNTEALLIKMSSEIIVFFDDVFR